MELIVETSVFDDERLSDDVQEVQQIASTAINIAGNNSQYFWHTETGTDTGVHITLTPQDTFKANPSGYNLLARNNGVEVRDGLTACSVFTNSGTYFNAMLNGTNQLVAKYEASGAQIGVELSGYRNMTIDNTNGIRFRNGTTVLAKYDTGSVIFYDGNSSTNYELMNLGTTGMTIKNSSGYSTFYAGNSGLIMYDGSSSLNKLLNLTNLGLTLKGIFNNTLSNIGIFDSDGLTIYGYIGSTIRGEIAKIYSGSGNAESGTSVAPYYTLGIRKTGQNVGNYSFATGYNTTASGYASHAEGDYTVASLTSSHAEGRNSIASQSGAHAEGHYTTASGEFGSHAEGYGATASGNYGSHAEGSGATASGDYGSHAEGASTIASGIGSHAEGYYTNASGAFGSHAEGRGTIASGISSHAQNMSTVATESYQTVIGKYNKATVTGSGTTEDPYVYTDVGNFAFIIGNGTSNITAGRSNAFTVSWDGQVVANATGYTDGQAKVQVSIDGTSKVWMGVGTGGTNHGVYSTTRGDWLITATTENTQLPLVNGLPSSGTLALHINKNGTLSTSSSSKRFKHDIKAINSKDIGWKWLYDLPVVQFIYNEDRLAKDDDWQGQQIPGFIAEDVAELCPIAASYDDKGLPMNWNERHILPLMLKLIQEQKGEIESLKVEMKNLKR